MVHQEPVTVTVEELEWGTADKRPLRIASSIGAEQKNKRGEPN